MSALYELNEKWKEIDSRLRKLDKDDFEEEYNKTLTEAYGSLILAYQEARSLNDEMEEIIKDYIDD